MGSRPVVRSRECFRIEGEGWYFGDEAEQLVGPFPTFDKAEEAFNGLVHFLETGERQA